MMTQQALKREIKQIERIVIADGAIEPKIAMLVHAREGLIHLALNGELNSPTETNALRERINKEIETLGWD